MIGEKNEARGVLFFFFIALLMSVVAAPPSLTLGAAVGHAADKRQRFVMDVRRCRVHPDDCPRPTFAFLIGGGATAASRCHRRAYGPTGGQYVARRRASQRAYPIGKVLRSNRTCVV